MAALNPFDTGAMGAGYARSRPPVHPHIVRMIVESRNTGGELPRRALDVGCGAGLSTKALEGHARQRIGLEPAESMLGWTGEVAPGADFVVGTAEALPIESGSIDLMTAAGSLNYVNLDRFLPEAARVLARGGVLAVYDFSPGNRFADSPALAKWTEAFHARYPKPESEARPLDPAILAGLDPGRFALTASRTFTIPITLVPRFYVDYMLTETNVAAAVRRGTPIEEIRGWCEETLAPVWEGRERPVLFSGYFACLSVRVG